MMRAMSLPDAFRPTEYAAALLQVLDDARADAVLELGVGSGVVLAALLQRGARQAVGVDIEPAALDCTRHLLDGLGLSERAELLQGDLWAPVEGRRFDRIVTNLPQFPLHEPLADGRLPSWSVGGADGRQLIDRFLHGLPAHLQPGGQAFMTHNRFADSARTLALLAGLGLRGSVACRVRVPLSEARWQALPEGVRERFLGQGLERVGPYAFGEFEVLEISAAA